ncbi:MAG: hypothetical protein MK066_10425 [Crocinitomicaceae bacterium]|nr:hypothetical protein [Crocinitomicaceae bacterium]
MKTILAVFVMMFVGTSFGQSKRAMPTSTPVTTIEGVVQAVESNPCGVYIIANVNGKRMRLFPESLPQEFSEQNLEIVFDYTETNSKTAENCGNMNKVHVFNIRPKNRD